MNDCPATQCPPPPKVVSESTETLPAPIHELSITFTFQDASEAENFLQALSQGLNSGAGLSEAIEAVDSNAFRLSGRLGAAANIIGTAGET